MLEFWFNKYVLGWLGTGEPVAQLQPLKALKAFNGFKLIYYLIINIILTDNILLLLQKNSTQTVRRYFILTCF